MVTSDHASSVQAVCLQVTQLNADGSPMQGTTTSFLTTAFMKLGFTAEYTKGVEVEEKGADGSVCVYYQAADILKRVTLSLEICAPSPELTAILTGGDLLQPVGVNNPDYGYAAPVWGIDSNPNGCAIEVWSRAIVNGRPAPINPYWRWIFPYAKMYFTGERTMENGALANAFQGWGIGNSNYGGGGSGTWAWETDRAFQYARTATAPVGINSYVSVAPPLSSVNQVETVSIMGKPTGGTFALSFLGIESAALAWNITASALQTAFQTMSSIGAGNVTVADTGTTAPVITLGTATSGGAFTAGAQFWVVTAIVGGVESVASNEVTATLTSDQEQPINWSAVASATGYNVYRGTTTGMETVLVATLGAVVTYTDTGTAGVAGVPPTNHGPFTVTFLGALAAQPLPVFDTTANALTGGSFPSVTSAVTTAGVV